MTGGVSIAAEASIKVAKQMTKRHGAQAFMWGRLSLLPGIPEMPGSGGSQNRSSRMRAGKTPLRTTLFNYL